MTAFSRRMMLDTVLADTPDIVGRDLRTVADQIVKRDAPK